MYKIHLLILLTAFVGVAVPDIIEKTDCTLRNGEPGECRLIYNCPETLKYLHRFGYRRQAVRCGFDDTTEIVCCKKDDPPKTREEDPPILFSDDNDGYYPYFSTTRQPSRRSTTRRQTWRTTETTTTELPFTFSDGERRCVTACNQYKNTRGQSVETHILYGEEVSPGDLPHMAALGYMKETGISFDCGGSLISNEYVLTAAHCISTVENIPPTIVRLGTVTLNGTFDTTDTDYVIQNITIHPGYDRLKKHEDIALIRLDRKVNLNKVIFPACLDTEGVDPISPMFIAGWGLTENETRSNILLEARVKSVPIEECTGYYVNGRSFRKHYPNGLLPSQMCAKDENNRADSCQGDSGGPLYSKLEDVEAMYKIFGITSFGGKCGVNPGVYTRVSNYLDWIENEVWP